LIYLTGKNNIFTSGLNYFLTIAMSFRVLYITATEREADAFRSIMESGDWTVITGKRKVVADLLVTGVGAASTAWNFKNWLAHNGRPDLVINGGIAGSFREKYKIGTVLMPVTDCFADSGIEDHDNFLTLFEAGLADPGSFPFSGGMLVTDSLYPEKFTDLMPLAKAITVNTVSGSERTIRKLREKFDPDIETMEGATLFYTCAMERIPFMAVRAVSNMVEPRNRDNWNIELALSNLTDVLTKVLLRISDL
jgi:futalosine hydrolase